MGIFVIVDNELHHCRRHDETSARSARQLHEIIIRWLREIRMTACQLCEGMLQENIDVFVNIGAVERDDGSNTLPRSFHGYFAQQRLNLLVPKGFADMRFRATRE
jgi:hypothetical protein